jgi:membrane protease YdiL (CAAX protease family)
MVHGVAIDSRLAINTWFLFGLDLSLERRIKMDEKMKRKFGIYVFLGLLIGALFGIFLGAGSENPFLGIGGGAFAGAAIGWFIAAAVMEKGNKKK